MYNYLIVDDEPLIRMGTLKKLESLSDRICCIGEADNGRQAIDLTEQFAPDLILLDMEMPVMNGTALLSYLSENHPDIQLIVISGYKSFDYIKHAIANNAIDYILKPFTEEQIKKTVLQALERIETSASIHAQLQVSEEQREIAFYEHDIWLLQNLILDYGISDTEIHSKKLSFIRNSERFLLLLFYTSVSTEKINPKSYLTRLGYSELALFLPHPTNPNLGFFLLSVSARAGYTPQAFCTRFIDEFTSYMETFQAISYWGVSNTIPTLELLHTAYKQSSSALGSMPVLQAHSSTYTYSEESSATATEIFWDKKDEFLFRIEAGMTERVHELLTELQTLYQTLPNLTLADVKYHYHQLTEDCLLILKQYLNQPSASGSMHNIVNEIFSIAELHHYYMRFFENLSTMLKPQSVYAIQDTIEQIKIYTQRNYQKNLTVDFLASLFYMNSSYLSHLFRRQTGEKYVQYLNGIRIAKAKDLLLTTDRKLYQIARSVGYDNVKYFFRVFKKWEGITPEQYRSKK